MRERTSRQALRAPGTADGDASLAIIVPMLNEVCALAALLPDLQALQRQGCEVLLVDGGSADASVAVAQHAGLPVLPCSRGRARQMNAGARAARGNVLLFLHADTRLPADAQALIRQAFSSGARTWGFFSVRIEGRSRMLRGVSLLMNLRSRLTRIATGDQALFVRRSAFERVGGFPDQPLMEDVELSRRLRRETSPVHLRAVVTTSGRRWESRGVWRTIFLMWRLRLAYWRGVPAEKLARLYR